MSIEIQIMNIINDKLRNPIMNKYIVSYINRISNEPQTIGGLFKDLECELHRLAIAMQTFILILDEIAKIEDLVSIIAVLQDVTQLGAKVPLNL